MSWYESARDHIARTHEALPADIPFEDRKRAIQEAYPWGERKYHPYKMWLKAQREYLLRFAAPDHDSKRFPLSPLERAIARSKRLDDQRASS